MPVDGTSSLIARLFNARGDIGILHRFRRCGWHHPKAHTRNDNRSKGK